MLGNKDVNLRLMKIYIMHALLWNGFDTCQEQTLSVLTDFLVHYVKKMGLESKKIANLSGRSSTTIFDLLLLLNNCNYKLSSEITDFIKASKKTLGNRVTFMNDLLEITQPENVDQNQQFDNETNTLNIDKKKIDKTLKRKLATILNEDKNKTANKDFPSFYPNFPEDFCCMENKNNDNIGFEEAEIKKIKSMQKRQTNSEISKILEFSHEREKYVDKKIDKTEIQEEYQNEINPFNVPLKKIKSLAIHDITKSQLF